MGSERGLRGPDCTHKGEAGEEEGLMGQVAGEMERWGLKGAVGLRWHMRRKGGRGGSEAARWHTDILNIP